MNMARSSSNSAIALEAGDRDFVRTMVRWAVLGAAGVIALIIALSHSMSASAAAPCVQINYTTCVAYGATYVGGNAVAYTNTNSGYPANTVVSTYYDPRYGVVSVVSDGSGNLIDINASTGQRIYPVFPDYGYGAGYIAGNFAGNYAGNFIGNPGYLNGNVCNAVYFCPSGFYGNTFNGVFNNGAFPAGATNVGGIIYYKDTRFCPGDGSIALIPGRGYVCANGQVVNNGVGGFPGYVYPNYRFLEVTQPTTAPVAAPVTAAPVAAAPVATAPDVAPTVEQAPVVAAPQMATALNTTPTQAPVAPTGGGGDVHILSVQTAAPAATTVDRDDHSG